MPAPEPSFLGTHVSGTAQIEIPARDLKVEVGASGRVVKIFSTKNDELDCQISDQNGIVCFEDLEPGIYKIMVEGFEIKEIRSTR